VTHTHCRCSGRVSFIGAPAPFAFRRLTQESAVAETVALFERRDPQHTAAEVDSSNCRLLAQILENANASELLPNFVAAEFNDNDGTCIRLLQFLT
jgi:hypothetical protein